MLMLDIRSDALAITRLGIIPCWLAYNVRGAFGASGIRMALAHR